MIIVSFFRFVGMVLIWIWSSLYRRTRTCLSHRQFSDLPITLSCLLWLNIPLLVTPGLARLLGTAGPGHLSLSQSRSCPPRQALHSFFLKQFIIQYKYVRNTDEYLQGRDTLRCGPVWFSSVVVSTLTIYIWNIYYNGRANIMLRSSHKWSQYSN